MDIAKSETFKNFIILNKALLFLIKLSKTAVQSVPKNIQITNRITKFSVPSVDKYCRNAITSRSSCAIVRSNEVKEPLAENGGTIK